MSSIDPLSVPFLHSCERCRQKKRRCSGEKPACAWCRDHHIPCRYRRTLRFNKQLENLCPQSSITALSVPVVLSEGNGSGTLPKIADTPPVLSPGSQPAGGSQQAWIEPSPSGIPASSATPGSAAPINGDLFSADALARLFSVDMVPHTNPPPPDVLQVVNSYITPFHDRTPVSAPECAPMTHTEANVLANLGDVATARQRGSPQEWMPVGFNDVRLEDTMAEQLSQHFLDGEAMFTMGSDFASQGLGDLLPSFAGSDNATPPVASSLPPYMQGFVSTPRLSRLASPTGSLGPSLPTAAVAAPSGTLTAGFAREGSSTSLHSSAASDCLDSGTQPAVISRSNTDPHPSSVGPKPASQGNCLSTAKQKSAEATPSATITSAAADEVPHILNEYVSAIPGQPSAAVIYKIMRESFKAPRMGMVSLNMELLWYMLHRSVLPRIVFYGHISSTIRCSVANLDVKSMVPPQIDESCYELALNEVPLVKDCAAIWGAIGLCMITRYEFQSSRYKEMAQHVDMALDIMHRIQFQGHSYPWHGVAAAARESFGFQYLIAIYWKCFWWKLISLLLIEQNDSFIRKLDCLPVYSSKTYNLYTIDQAYDVDLMDMIPPGSWLGADDAAPPKLRFRGPRDLAFMGLRPPGSPNFGRESLSGAYLQQLLVVYARFFAQQCQAREGKVGLCPLLKELWTFRERMHVWRNSLPPTMVLDRKLVADYLETIKPDSKATPLEIDLKATQLKDVITLLLTYHTFLVRANRFVMKMMLGEPLNVPPPDVGTLAFALRDLYDSRTSPPVVSESLGYMNMYFHGCRIQAIKSANALCSIAQAAYSCKFNFYTLGSQIVFTMLEVLVVYVGFLGNHDENIAWRSKSRLSNVFNILRMLRHWAPALHIFVAGIKALSDPRFCLDEPRNFNLIKREVLDPSMLDMSDSPMESAVASDDDDAGVMPPKRRRVVRMPQALESPSDARTNIRTSTAPNGIAASGVRRDETLSYRAADPIPEFPNPFPPKHVISLVIRDLGLSLAEFLAPAYPILLLKLMPSRDLYPDKPQMFGSIR